MNYQKIYNNLINHAKRRISEGYVEKHHIVPRCLGGTDAKENIVSLYPEEHYLAHLLLCKVNKGNSKLLYAAMNMTSGSMINNGKRNNKAYGWLRRQYKEPERCCDLGRLHPIQNAGNERKVCRAGPWDQLSRQQPKGHYHTK